MSAALFFALGAVLGTPAPPRLVALPPPPSLDGSFTPAGVAPDGDGDALAGAAVRRGPFYVYFAEYPSPTNAGTLAPDDGALDDDGALPSASLRSLAAWMLALLAMGLGAGILGNLASARRPLPVAAFAPRPVPLGALALLERLLVLACLWSPMLMLLALLQAERALLSSLWLSMAAAGALSSLVMLVGRRRLAARLRWALSVARDEPLNTLPDNTLVAAEVEPRKMAPPPGSSDGPWFRGDVCVSAAGEPARVSLERAVVDDAAARVLLGIALGRQVGARLTVIGATGRAPSDAGDAPALTRLAPTQPRISGSRPLIVLGSPRDLERRLRVESALLAGVLALSAAVALLTLC
jgi:hypothetical protein